MLVTMMKSSSMFLGKKFFMRPLSASSSEVLSWVTRLKDLIGIKALRTHNCKCRVKRKPKVIISIYKMLSNYVFGKNKIGNKHVKFSTHIWKYL